MRELKVAIVGATGLVGQSILEILKEENLIDEMNLTLYVSNKSAGGRVVFDGKVYELIKLDENSCHRKFDLVFFSAGDDVSLEYAKIFADGGAYVIDNSNAFRREKDVPLIVPEINGDILDGTCNLIANPNCSTIELALVLNRIKDLGAIDEVIVSTYQSVSGAGADALADLHNDTSNVFKKGIKDNIVAQIGEIKENGFCTEEDKLMFETCKILNSHFNMIATAVRVPISYCHGESVVVKFKSLVSSVCVKEALRCDYIDVSEGLHFPTDCAGTNLTYVSRIRNHHGDEVAMFVLADNLRRGASFNAVEIAKILINKFLWNFITTKIFLFKQNFW